MTPHKPSPLRGPRRIPLTMLCVVVFACAAVGSAVLGWQSDNSRLEATQQEPWQVPTDPVEKRAYEYAHALPLPTGMPKSIPFDFEKARITESDGGKSVAQQYFEHLCRTEDVEVIVKVAKDVDGLQVMRPRPDMERLPINTDRYGAEEPTGYGWLADNNQLDPGEGAGYGWGMADYVQPLYGVYAYVEYQQPGSHGTFYRAMRNAVGNSKYAHGIDGSWRAQNGGPIHVPYVIHRRSIPSISARYAYTWRGIRRPRDRELGIGGGEFLVIDKVTGEVLAAKRTFNSTYVPGRPDFTNWYAARECRPLGEHRPLPLFIQRVLNPRLSVNDAFVPGQYLQEYHESMKAKEAPSQDR